ncbi:MAG: glycosyltransferase family 4 protein [Caldilineaceae bacterium]
MRILFLTNFYPPHDYGGYEQWCHEVALRLQQRGHMLAVLTSRYRRQQKGEDSTCAETTEVARTCIEAEPHVSRTLHLETDLHFYDPRDFFRRAHHERENQARLREQIEQVQPDVIMVWGMWNLSHNLTFWAEELRPGRVAYFISNYWPADIDPHTAFWQLPTRRPMLNLVKRPLRSLALAKLEREGYPPQLKFEHALCCSNYVRDTLIEAGKLPVHAGVLYGGTDPQPFLANSSLARSDGAGKQKLRLLYFGRLDPEKGVHTALEALGLLRERSQLAGVTLTIIGSGHPAYEAKLQQLVVEHQLEEHVTFIAKVPREEIPTWLGRFDVYLFTSTWPEPMARSVMEAMAAGLLVIGTEVGGQLEMLTHNRNALTFQAEDAQMLATHIAYIAKEPALRRQLAQAGQALVLAQFTLDRMVNEIEEYLTGIVNGAAVPAG